MSRLVNKRRGGMNCSFLSSLYRGGGRYIPMYEYVAPRILQAPTRRHDCRIATIVGSRHVDPTILARVFGTLRPGVLGHRG